MFWRPGDHLYCKTLPYHLPRQTALYCRAGKSDLHIFHHSEDNVFDLLIFSISDSFGCPYNWRLVGGVELWSCGLGSGSSELGEELRWSSVGERNHCLQHVAHLTLLQQSSVRWISDDKRKPGEQATELSSIGAYLGSSRRESSAEDLNLRASKDKIQLKRAIRALHSQHLVAES